MTSLAIASTLLGLVIVAKRLPGIIWPTKYREHALKFPRSVMPGRVLMVVVAAWAGIVLFGAASGAAMEAAHEPGASELWKLGPPAVVIGMPIAYWLVIRYADQFLAMRAVAALMLLVGNVVVRTADRSESSWRLVVTVLMYLWVVVAIWMAIAPHHFRDVLQYFMANDKRCRAMSAVGLAVGVVLVALGMWVY